MSAGASIAPDPTGGAYSAPPDPLAGFKGPTSKGRGGEGRGRGGERRGRGRNRGGEGKGGEGESRPTFQLVPTPLLAMLFNSGLDIRGIVSPLR